MYLLFAVLGTKSLDAKHSIFINVVPICQGRHRTAAVMNMSQKRPEDQEKCA